MSARIDGPESNGTGLLCDLARQKLARDLLPANCLPRQSFPAKVEKGILCREYWRRTFVNDTHMAELVIHSDGVSSPDWHAGEVPLRVAYQGEPGAYSESAAIEYFGEGVQLVPCETFEKVFELVEGEGADRAVLPIENSLAGTIHRNYDLLLQHRLHIVGEVDFCVRHYLLALEGVQLGDVRVVQSHPMALAQCERFLSEHGFIREVALDTAGSARLLRDKGYRDRAAIAGARAAQIYALNILREDIEDESENYTRFLILARTPCASPPLGTPAKTSIAFSLINTAGALFKALSVFALRDIDLTKIESRHLRSLRHLKSRDGSGVNPDPQNGIASPMTSTILGGVVAAAAAASEPESVQDRRRWEYLFYLDISASLTDAKTTNALNHLAEIATFIRVLGSYKRHAMN